MNNTKHTRLQTKNRDCGNSRSTLANRSNTHPVKTHKAANTIIVKHTKYQQTEGHASVKTCKTDAKTTFV